MNVLWQERPFSMLGLGDIVVPGVFVALLLRCAAPASLAASKPFRVSCTAGADTRGCSE